MCTVTFFPKGKDQYILTSNRDVAPARHADTLIRREMETYTLVYPQDPEAGGSWIAMDDQGRAACLLNGGFVKHKSRPPYRKSRGLVVLESFEWDSFEAFAKDYDFDGIEPFTLIGLRPREGYFEFKWTGEIRFLRQLERPEIFSSATLFDRAMRAKRKKWFRDWLKTHADPGEGAILDFHIHGGEQRADFGFVMNRRNVVCTTSLSQIRRTANGTELYHRDLISGSEETATLPAQQPSA